MERIQKYISRMGFASRRKAEELIREGKVYVNGTKVTELGIKVSSDDVITINNEVIDSSTSYVYYLLNKPRNVISSTKDNENRQTVVDLIDTDKRIYPIGRLDYDTTGAIILTNDGTLTDILTHPRNEVDKTYVAKIKGFFKVTDLKKLKSGLVIDNYKTSPCKAKVKSYDKKTNTSIIEVVIHEGKNHQVKNMFKVLGYDVLKLKREKYAFLTLKGLSSGKYRTLTLKEVKTLYSLGKNKKSS